jgi:RNA polymerase sigma factor (sigma-70 family)
MKVASRELQTLFSVGTLGGLTDGRLLERFADQRDEAAFEVLVHRHGPMVWGVCRRVLRDHHDAEDAFQATLLVLARKGQSIAHRELVANWLYGVAYQTARKARATRARRQDREGQVTDMPEPEVACPDLRDDLTELLDRELSRLPEKYRIPIALCELEGKSHREAAEQLGWPIGTVSGRLSRARSLLAKRLTRRGVSLSGGALAVLLAQESASASMPPRLIGATARAASLFAAGGAATAGVVPARVTALTGEMLKIMLLSQIRITTTALLVGVTLTVVGTGLAYQAKPPQEKAGGSHRREKSAPQKAQGVVAPPLPGSTHHIFGGRPGEPRYERHGDLFFVTSPLGDKFSIYDAATNKASTVRLPGSKESSLQVTPILSEGNLVGLMLNGPKISRLYVFSLADWKWYPQDIKEPVAGVLNPIVASSVAGYAQGRTIYAFSTEAKRWNILELPQEAPPQLDMFVSSDSVVVEYDNHIYEFSGKTGEWKHMDLRALIDAAIKSAEEGAQ